MTSSKTKRRGPGIVVRRCGIHGRGVFARRLIREDETVCEYNGEIISETEVARRYPEDMGGLNHTFAFGVEHDYNIDGGGAKGNIARWINHSCGPNCDTYEQDKRIYVRAIRDIRPSEELFYDYAIEAGERLTEAVKARRPCCCGAKKCRGTVLVPTPKPKKKKRRPSAGQREGVEPATLSSTPSQCGHPHTSRSSAPSPSTSCTATRLCASMRPRHHTAENAQCLITYSAAIQGFNEAAASHRGKPPWAICWG